MPQNARYTAASASRFQFLGAISTPAIQFFSTISDHFNTAYLTLRSYLSIFPNQQFIKDFNQITTTIILILQTFLQIKYQGINNQKDSPFSTHPIVMSVAVYSSVVHFFTYGIMLRFPLHRLTFLAHQLLVSSGNITVTALSSVLLPGIAAPFVYAIFGLLSAVELLLWLHRNEEEAGPWIQIRLIHHFFSNIFGNLRWRIHHFFSNIFGNLGYFNEQRMPRLQV